MRGRMPTGVVSPRAAAALIEAKKSKLTIASDHWSDRVKALTADRKKLMDAARAGNKRAIKELWKEYRCRIYREPVE